MPKMKFHFRGNITFPFFSTASWQLVWSVTWDTDTPPNLHINACSNFDEGSLLWHVLCCHSLLLSKVVHHTQNQSSVLQIDFQHQHAFKGGC